MKLAASIFSWIDGAIIMICVWISCFFYLVPQSIGWIFLPILDTTLVFGILIWRHMAVENGYKVGCGVCTLIFVSLIGGILTLCIPDDQLGYNGSANYSKPTSYNSSSSSYYNSSYNPVSSTPTNTQPVKRALSEDERIGLIVKYKKLRDDGAITEEEYEAKKSELLKK